jgi:nicotinamide-nucleotide amidase
MHSVEIIAIGNELLIGKTIDTNSAWMGRKLGEIGLSVERVTRIADEGPAIRQSLERALAEYSIVLLTGGLGQTKDDITKKVLADYFETPLVEHAATLAHITMIYEMRGRQLNDISRQGAYLPESCFVLPNGVGLSPGMQFDAGNGRVVFSMPGVPHEMQYLMNEHVLPYLSTHYQQDHVAHHTFCTAGIPESSMAQRLKDFEREMPEDMSLAYNPSLSQLNLRLGLRCPRGEAQVRTEVFEAQLERLRYLLGPDCFGEGEDTLEKVLGRILVDKGLTIATAESCTGGAIAARIVSAVGASAYLMGGIVAYDNRIKQEFLGVSVQTLAEHGAVSEATAIAMAEGVRARLGTSIGISSTGVAGPDGGSTEKPVGTVWIGYSDAQQSFARKYLFERDRQRNIERTVATALNVTRKVLLGLPM